MPIYQYYLPYWEDLFQFLRSGWIMTDTGALLFIYSLLAHIAEQIMRISLAWTSASLIDFPVVKTEILREATFCPGLPWRREWLPVSNLESAFSKIIHWPVARYQLPRLWSAVLILPWISFGRCSLHIAPHMVTRSSTVLVLRGTWGLKGELLRSSDSPCNRSWQFLPETLSRRGELLPLMMDCTKEPSTLSSIYPPNPQQKETSAMAKKICFWFFTSFKICFW